MIEQGVLIALHNAEPGSKQELQAKALRGVLDAVKADGFQDTPLPALTKEPALPEGAIRLPDLTIGGVKSKGLEKLLSSNGHRISDYAKYLLGSPDFTTLPKPQTISLVRSTVSAMGLSDTPTTEQIFERADELGWDLCPAEVGPHLRLAYTDQPLNEWLSIGMKQISDSYGDPDVFELGHFGGGSWLCGHWANPAGRWDPRGGVVFSLRPRTQAELGAGQASSES